MPEKERTIERPEGKWYTWYTPRDGMGKVYWDFEAPFLYHFGVPLSQYFSIDHGGFLLQAFMSQVLEYSGSQPGAKCYKKFGAKAKNVVADIMVDCALVMRKSKPKYGD